MKNYLIDTHAHVDMLDDFSLEGVGKVIIPSVEEKTMDKIIELAQDPNIYAMVGIFPSEAKTYTQEIEDRMIERAKNPKVVAVGEIGLDYYWDKSFNDIQQEVFIKQIKMANKLELPIVIHDREAHKDTFDILKEVNKNSKVLFHCFSGSVEFMKECTREGWSIAIGGVVTFKNAVKMKDVTREVPLDKLVLETDAPYLTPVPFRGKPNKPAYVKYVAEEIAAIRNMPVEEIIDITTTNAEEFFKI
ncbi:MAG: TatD family hydrolase [Candidatus Gastranaerophilales bacterium]|nr:TatD family hydrolase [Candidatus Gastranaerophilales bacterium]MCM1073501.1 TatD family hydrolase [Bacteroides sp.]